MRGDWIKNSLQNDLHSLCEAGNPPTTLFSWDDHLKMTYLTPPISTATIHRISKTKKRAVKQTIICPRAANADHDIAHNTKTTDNTGINKYSKATKKNTVSINAGDEKNLHPGGRKKKFFDEFN